MLLGQWGSGWGVRMMLDSEMMIIVMCRCCVRVVCHGCYLYYVTRRANTEETLSIWTENFLFFGGFVTRHRGPNFKNKKRERKTSGSFSLLTLIYKVSPNLIWLSKIDHGAWQSHFILLHQKCAYTSWFLQDEPYESNENLSKFRLGSLNSQASTHNRSLYRSTPNLSTLKSPIWPLSIWSRILIKWGFTLYLSLILSNRGGRKIINIS